MRDLSSELPFENLTSGIAIDILKVVDCGMKPKLVSGCGIRKAYFGPSTNPLNNFMIRLREGWLRIMSPEWKPLNSCAIYYFQERMITRLLFFRVQQFPFHNATRNLQFSRQKINDAIARFEQIAGLQVTSRRPCWWSRTKAFLSAGNELYFDANLAEKFLLYWPPTWHPCHVVTNQE